MSVWKRLFGLERAPGAEPTEEPSDPSPPPGAVAGASGAPEVPQTPELRFAYLGAEPGRVADEAQVLALYEELAAAGREARAIDLARRVLAHTPELHAIRLRIAKALSSRGDDAGAAEVLAPLIVASEPPLPALMLAAEVAERKGDAVAAMAFYQRVIARDFDYAQARERVARLRERGELRRDLVGATLMTDGALARGRYRLSRELGRGGAGTVFAARDDHIGRTVALKVYHRRGRVERERLLREARTPAMIEHPGIVRIFDLDPGLGAIAMEWVKGGSVRKCLEEGPITVERASRWLRTALEALEFVHQVGVVHRDLKPSNFLLRRDDRVVLTDFGLATPEGEAGLTGGQGTLAYMAPEQRGEALAAPAEDMHAFGASMREILGRVTGEVPRGWVEIAEACLTVDPASRPALFDLRTALK